MKRFVTTIAAAALFATSAYSGSLVEPEMEPMVEVMEEEPGSSASSGGLLIPLLALVAIAVLISNDDDDPEPCEICSD